MRLREFGLRFHAETSGIVERVVYYAYYVEVADCFAVGNKMTTRDFKVFLEPDEDYGGYVVVCPSLPGCYSQGKTVSEAMANIREAIDLCIEDMESRGEEILRL
jgi:predicted RNase H-like HicB family nuclease